MGSIKKHIVKFIQKKRLNQIFQKDITKYTLANVSQRFNIDPQNFYPCLYDNTGETHFDAHYIYHPAWAARVLKKINPQKHVDISSILSFSTIISAFLNVDFYDFRPATLTLSNLNSKQADLTSLHFASESIECLSCLHTVEHVGLGRYGDDIDPDGDIKAINELKRVVAINGHLLFVVPVGKPALKFNAHRIYSYEMIMSYFNEFTLKEFVLITDNGEYLINPDPQEVAMQSYGCGCFYFQKTAS